MVQYYQISI